MALKKFTLASLVEMDDGRLKTAIEQAVERMLADCRDRPGLIEARQTTLVINMTPIANQDTIELDSVAMEFHLNEKMPKRKTKMYEMQAKSSGLFFNDLSPDNPSQGTLDEVEGFSTPRGPHVKEAKSAR